MTSLDRRSVARAAVWSVPAIVLATAAPSFAASGATDVGAFRLTGTCGVPGVAGPGFLLAAGPDQPLPVGTVVTIVGSGVSNIGQFSVSGGTAQVAVLSGTARQVTLTAELPAGATMAMRTTLSTSVSFRLSAVASLPDDYVGTGSKTAGSVSSTTSLCTAS